jgi:hypothetical protein
MLGDTDLSTECEADEPAVEFRRFGRTELSRVVEIDRRERINVRYDQHGAQLVARHGNWSASAWDPDGHGEHSVRGQGAPAPALRRQRRGRARTAGLSEQECQIGTSNHLGNRVPVYLSDSLLRRPFGLNLLDMGTSPYAGPMRASAEAVRTPSSRFRLCSRCAASAAGCSSRCQTDPTINLVQTNVHRYGVVATARGHGRRRRCDCMPNLLLDREKPWVSAAIQAHWAMEEGRLRLRITSGASVGSVAVRHR